MANYQRDGRSPIPESEVTSRVMSANRGKGTIPEITLRKALWNSGLRGYRVNCKNLPGSPDIVFVRKKIVIFVNGCFWHRCPLCNPRVPKTHKEFWEEKFAKNRERDIEKLRVLEEQGWTVLVVWECQLKDQMDEIMLMIRNAISP